MANLLFSGGGFDDYARGRGGIVFDKTPQGSNFLVDELHHFGLLGS